MIELWSQSDSDGSSGVRFTVNSTTTGGEDLKNNNMERRVSFLVFFMDFLFSLIPISLGRHYCASPGIEIGKL